MSSSIDLSNPGRSIHVGVILLNSVTELLDLAPVGFFSTISYNFLKNLPPLLVSDDVKAKALDIQFHWVTENGQSLAHLTGNLHVSPTDSFATCPPLDIVVLGANQVGYQASDIEKEFLRKCHAECTAFLCICGGFEPALYAGLLEGAWPDRDVDYADVVPMA
ncbi:uncharacterized protein TRUGW13939_09451 [Talaromyces rugulosus]|uniref:DJ-1/PfpI domain-containing protein n=1 Tax=Talaromyces rugulosus TaxID=121627 RepID=A0A7H8R7E5_TALRU|nr:uncharacterized protein TRUGW13939_09451 [Talaromyces rugulosus]QKX62292.1 hypothetical protein TRUGW13939_09451 [Talaromyces rugulosus]